MKRYLVLILLVWSSILFAEPQKGLKGDENGLPTILSTASPLPKTACAVGKPRTSQGFLASFTSSDGKTLYHLGTDIQCKPNAPITAPFTAKIIRAQNTESTKGWGSYVMAKARLKSGTEVCYLVAHLAYNSVKVQVGQLVPAGTIIGVEGNTGNVRGANGGYHQHLQIVDCGVNTGDAPFQGYTSDFDVLRHYYNPLQFIDEHKNRTITRVTFNRVRLQADMSFADHSWITTVPPLGTTHQWNIPSNGWQERIETKTYGKASQLTYQKRYFVTQRSNQQVTFRPYLEQGGLYNICYVVPHGTFSGEAQATIYHTDVFGEQQPWHIKTVTFRVPNNAYAPGECHDVGTYYCAKGAKCRIAVRTTNVQNRQEFPFYEVQFRLIGGGGETYLQYRNMGRYQESRRRYSHYVRPHKTIEWGILSVGFTASSIGRSLTLRAQLKRKDGKKYYLPCVNNTTPGETSYCVVPGAQSGDEIFFDLGEHQRCNKHCGLVFVYLSGYENGENVGEILPTPTTSAPDMLIPGHWASAFSYRSILLGFRSPIYDDYNPTIGFSKGDRLISVAAFAKMIVMATGPRYPAPCTEKPYADVPKDAWYCPYIAVLKARFSQEYQWYASSAAAENRKFFPEAFIARRRALELAAFSMGSPGKAQGTLDPSRYLCDANTVYPELGRQIEGLFQAGIFAGFMPRIERLHPCRLISPEKTLTYHEADRIAVRVFATRIARDQYKDN